MAKRRAISPTETRPEVRGAVRPGGLTGAELAFTDLAEKIWKRPSVLDTATVMRNCGVSRPTATRYLRLLVDTSGGKWRFPEAGEKVPDCLLPRFTGRRGPIPLYAVPASLDRRRAILAQQEVTRVTDELD